MGAETDHILVDPLIFPRAGTPKSKFRAERVYLEVAILSDGKAKLLYGTSQVSWGLAKSRCPRHLSWQLPLRAIFLLC